MNPTRLLVSSAATFIVAASLFAQAPPPPQTTPPDVQSEDASRDRSGDEPYDTPELYGSKPFESAKGSKLPALLAEYTVRSGKVYQRISLFENGVTALHIRGLGPDVQRRIVMPPETIQTLQTLVGMIDLPSIRAAETRQHDRALDYAQLRFVRSGVTHELLCGAREVVPQQVEAVRTMLGDLLNFIAEDRQVANPISSYAPALGDRLSSDDGHEYRVTRLVNDGTLVELESTAQSIHLFVPANMLYKMFVSVRRAEQ